MSAKRKDEEAIFYGALELKSAAERSAYLKRACGDDVGLLGRVEALLKVHDSERSIIEAAACSMDMTLEPERLAEGPGTRIGRYKLLELIGEGGFGAVYMAEQAEPIRRRVALKIIKLGMDTKQVIARFEAERQALALMEHPNIAKVLDAGATETGRPYFVMELVKGIPITEYCDKNNLDTRQRLKLFIDVCRAVQHAHQKGVIHRDIKPSNVMITLRDDGTPVPKIIDFGIAKATGQKLTEKTYFTQFRQFIGTPEYMSPEQAQMGEMDVDTRTDIYSLGVLLYELLTGTTPFNGERLRSSAYNEMLKTICETEPRKPSSYLNTLGDALGDVAKQRRIEPARLCKIIQGDLDWIVLKTLEKDRSRRYETANELATDIQRHLEDEPVAAGPPSAGYRIRKFVRRHRTGVLSALLLLVVLLTGLCLATAGFVQARRERNRAEMNLQRARDAVEEMKLVAEGLLVNRPQLEKLQPQLLQTVQAYYRGFLEENRNDPELRHEIGVAYKDLGYTHWTLGKPEEALAAYEKSTEVFEELAADFADEAEYKKQIAITGNWIGVALSTLRRYDEALEVYDRAAALLEGLVAEFGDEPEYTLPLSWIYRHRGFVLLWTGKLEEAENAFRKTLEIREKLVADYPDEQGYQHELALILGPLGHVLTQTGRYDEAEQALRRAVEISEKAAELSEVPEDRRAVAVNYTLLGELLSSTGRHSQAGDAFREVIKLSKQLTDEFGLDPIYSRTQAWGWLSLAQVLRRSGQLEEAEKACGEAIQLFERLAADYPEVPEHKEGLANSYGSLGDVLKDVGRLEEAERAYQKAQEIKKNIEAEKTRDKGKKTEGSKE